MQDREAGQVLPFVVLSTVIAAGLLFGIARIGGDALVAARARSAADAAALAGAAAGREAADELARANGGRLRVFEQEGTDARVEVELESATAPARARRAGPVAADDGARRGGLAPAMVAALARAEQLLGAPVPVTSGYRSPAQQARLYARRASNPYPVAPPGSSMHERGLAIDVPSGFVPTLQAVADQAGLCQPYPRADPVHFELCRG